MRGFTGIITGAVIFRYLSKDRSPKGPKLTYAQKVQAQPYSPEAKLSRWNERSNAKFRAKQEAKAAKSAAHRATHPTAIDVNGKDTTDE